MPIDSETELRVATFLADRAAYHDEMAARWRRLHSVMFEMEPASAHVPALELRAD